MNEIWKPIKGYKGYYEVSNFGRVRSCERYVKRGRYGQQLVKKHILKPKSTRDSYLVVCLSKNNKRQMKRVHRLVAEAFIPNPNKLSQVNHKDEDKTNNTVSNLEWCSSKYNINYGRRNKRVAKVNTNGALSKSVLQFTLDNHFVKRWLSINEAERQTGFFHANISACCKGKYKQAYGYHWKYAEKVD